MTNVSGKPGKVELRRRLVELGERALRTEGWSVARAGLGKSSMRRIRRGTEEKLATIRTSQDEWIAFPRNESDDGWSTLEQADIVVAVSVDCAERPQWIQAHVVDADEMRARFDRAYTARIEAGYQIDKGRGVWISLYESEAKLPVTLVGAGAGLVHKPVLREPIALEIETGHREEIAERPLIAPETRHLTIAEAKAGLALSFGIPESAIKISIEA